MESDLGEWSHRAHELICRFIEQTGRSHDSSARFEMHPKTQHAVLSAVFGSGPRAPGASIGWRGFELCGVPVHVNPSVKPGELQFIPYTVTMEWRKGA